MNGAREAPGAFLCAAEAFSVEAPSRSSMQNAGQDQLEFHQSGVAKRADP
jgi:hypothetical protein